MAIDIPNILLVFVHREDSATDRSESTELELLLRFTKTVAKNIDFDIMHERSFMNAIGSSAAIAGYKASIFHFSGNANEQALFTPVEKTGVSAISTFLKYIQTKFVFFNGGATRELLEDIFETTGVKAVMVIHSKIKDDDAVSLSVNFYKYFLREKNTLQKSFELMSAISPVPPLHTGGLLMKDGEIINNSGFPGSGSGHFEWGLFYNDPVILAETIDTIETVF